MLTSIDHVDMIVFCIKDNAFCLLRLWEWESVGPLGLGLGAAEGWMFAVLYWTFGDTCSTAPRFFWHWVWIWQSQPLQLSAGHILQGKLFLLLLLIHSCMYKAFTRFSSCTSVGKVAKGSIGSSHLLCGQPQSPWDEEQHWEVQTDGGSDWGGLPGQRDWEWETLGTVRASVMSRGTELHWVLWWALSLLKEIFCQCDCGEQTTAWGAGFLCLTFIASYPVT